MLKVGDTLDLGTKSRSRFAPFNVVLHISRVGGSQYCFCVVPIVFSKSHIARGVELSLEPPQSLNLAGLMPPIAVGVKTDDTEFDEDGSSVEIDEEIMSQDPDGDSGAEGTAETE